MTIIIGLETVEGVLMGSDSGVTAFITSPTYEKKTFRIGPLLIGHTGYVRAAQVVNYSMILRQQFSGETDHQYMVCGFAEALRNTLKDAGVGRVENNEEMSNDYWLVGYNGRLYEVGSNFSVNRPRTRFSAIGSGYAYALAAMEALKDLSPRERIKKSLIITGKFDPYVKSPWIIMEE